MPCSPFRHRTLLYQDCYPRDHEAVPWVGHHYWYWSGITVDKIWVGPPTLLQYLLEGCGQNWWESDKEKNYIAMQLRQDERSMTSSMWSMIKAMRAFTTLILCTMWSMPEQRCYTGHLTGSLRAMLLSENTWALESRAYNWEPFHVILYPVLSTPYCASYTLIYPGS